MAAKPNDSRAVRGRTPFIGTAVRAPLQDIKRERNLLRAEIACRP